MGKGKKERLEKKKQEGPFKCSKCANQEFSLLDGFLSHVSYKHGSASICTNCYDLILGFMTLDLSSLQCPEADLGSWGMSSSEPPPLDSVVALIQSLSPFRPVHFDFDLPRNMGLFDALLHESRCASNQSSVRCSNTCVVTSSGDIAEEYGDSISPVGHSAASVFGGNKHGDIILAKRESIYTDSGNHGSSMGAVVFSNIVTSVFPTYTQEVRTAEREFEGIAKLFENYPQVRLILKYDEALSHSIHIASDMFIIPSAFELCGLPQMIAMRNGATGGLNDR
ncbi:hypothetical protein AQUCO_02000277v1 [Aquilegia coerulea]|uniref:starch synthase n=1 Tax=Aquilegia coerulea TaxID=218851 RepID=A0A2G5DGT0_AQUCA|nr:hypothetical protein AQUCO_02000277v1 [Aquilegia coerulea]